MNGATVEDIRMAFAQELAAATARIKQRFNIPVEEAMTALFSASSLYVEVGKRERGWSDAAIKNMMTTGDTVGAKLYAALVQQEEAQDVPRLGQEHKLGEGESSEDEAREALQEQPGIVGPDDGKGVLDASGNEIKPDAMSIDGPTVVVSVLADTIMTAKFPINGLPIHPLDSISLMAASLEFLRLQPDVEATSQECDDRERYARHEVREAMKNIEDGCVKITHGVFGPSGPATNVEEAAEKAARKSSPLVDPRGRPLG